MSNKLNFGDWIKRQRKELDMTQEECAEQVGCAISTLQKFETGHRRPSRHLAERLTKVLEIAPEDYEQFMELARTGAALDLPEPPSELPPLLAPPMPLTPLLGRETELAELVALLQRRPPNNTVRLLTLTGPGGTGKTRLALQLAQTLATSFSHGVAFVELALLRDPQLVLSSIAQALGLKDQTDQLLLEKLMQFLQSRHFLLMLDNFEHLLPAAALLNDLLRAAPLLTIVVTSRAALRVSGEQEFLIPPLALPDWIVRGQALPPLTEFAANPAVALFVARASGVNASFVLNEQNAAVIAEICIRLDGLPLALELAAARMKIFSPQSLLERLDRRLPLLIHGAVDLPDRQRTLRTAINWSYDLLSSTEQVVFRHFAVFVGGATLAAAEYVIEARHEGQSSAEASAMSQMFLINALADVLESLFNKSLLRCQEDDSGQLRFSMLETIREYALEQFASLPEATHIQRRHAEYFAMLAERSEAQLRSADQARWLALMKHEHHNLRAALTWSSTHNPEQALQIGAALTRFWFIHGHFTEGRKWLRSLLEAGQSAPAASRAKAFHGLGLLAYAQGDYDQAITAYEASLILRRELGDTAGIAQLLNNLGIIAKLRGEYDQATTLYEHCVQLSREVNDTWGLANALTNLGGIAFDQADFVRAASYYQECVGLREQLGDTWGLCLMLLSLGEVAYHQADYHRAQELLSESLTLAQQIDDTAMRASILEAMGMTSLALGDRADARHSLIESVRIRQELGTSYTLVASLESFAQLRLAEGQASDTPRLLGAAALLREELGTPPSPVDRRRIASITDSVMEQISQADFELAWQSGRHMPLEDLLDHLLSSEAV